MSDDQSRAAYEAWYAAFDYGSSPDGMLAAAWRAGAAWGADEIERLRSQLDRTMRSLCALAGVDPEPTAGGWPQLAEAIHTLRAENERLRDVVAQVNSRCDHLGMRLGEVIRERNALRSDATRYRSLRDGSNWPAVFASHDAPEPLRCAALDAALTAHLPTAPAPRTEPAAASSESAPSERS